MKKQGKKDRHESEGMSKEHMKEYAHYSPKQLSKHMKQEKVLLKEKKAKKSARGR